MDHQELPVTSPDPDPTDSLKPALLLLLAGLAVSYTHLTLPTILRV